MQISAHDEDEKWRFEIIKDEKIKPVSFSFAESEVSEHFQKEYCSTKTKSKSNLVAWMILRNGAKNTLNLKKN